MKAFAILVLVFVQPLLASAGFPTVEELSSHLFTNGPIVWRLQTNDLPKQIWIYQRHLPRIFSASVITNAIVLGSLQSEGYPQPSTNETCIMAGAPCPCMSICNFSISPSEASMYYESPNYKNGSPNGIPSDKEIVKRAWECVPRLGLDPTQMIQKSFFAHSYNAGQDENSSTNFICGRGAFLSRLLDGISFFSADNTGGDAEGLVLELGSYGEIRYYYFRWSDMERYERQKTASLNEISECIKAHKAIVLPNPDEADYFARLRILAKAKKLTITEIAPVYGDGVFGKVPPNDAHYDFATPFAELKAIADFGTSNATVRLVSPILSSEVQRLFENK
jgi:hypothetical protein